MDKINETFSAMVNRVFGPDARLAGSVGTGKGPGQIRIMVDERVLGTGPTFQAALQDAEQNARNAQPTGAELAAWVDVETKLRALGLRSAEKFVRLAIERGKTPGDVFAGIRTYLANNELLKTPGAVAHFIQFDRWPVDGIQEPKQDHA